VKYDAGDYLDTTFDLIRSGELPCCARLSGKIREVSDDTFKGGWSTYPGVPTNEHLGRSEVGDDGEVLVAGSIAPVVGLGAICGLRSRRFDDESRSQRFWVSEFARLANGRRVILHEDRGFNIGPPIGPGAGDAVKAGVTREEIIETVLAVVLPDPEDGEEHPWAWLALLARARGLDVTAEDLRGLPYDVVLTDSLTRSLDA